MQKALILDLDGHYGQAVARRVRANHVFCEVYPGTMTGEKIRDFGAKAVILVGGSANPMSVCPDVFQLGVPIMGIGSGCTLMAKQLGGNLRTAPQGPCRSLTQLTSDGSLFDGLPDAFVAYMDHSQIVDTLPEGFIPTASADNCPVAGFCCPEKNLYGIQFHPELAHTQGGNKILSHFLHEVCGFDESWNMERVIPQAVAQLQRKIGNRTTTVGIHFHNNQCSIALIGKNEIMRHSTPILRDCLKIVHCIVKLYLGTFAIGHSRNKHNDCTNKM